MKKFVLGISCFYHDSAATLLCDGNIIAAVQEERFTRIKHDSSFPKQAIIYCLKTQKIDENRYTKYMKMGKKSEKSQNF